MQMEYGDNSRSSIENPGPSVHNQGAGSISEEPQSNYKMPSTLEVHVINKNNEAKFFKIEIIPANIEKPYVGGFRNVKNQKIYHHAFAQTDQRKRNHAIKNHRETQTYEYSTKSTKVLREFGVQMERQGIWVDPRQDKEVQSKKYFTSEMWDQRREAAALYIQRLVRGWFARKKTNALKKAQEEKKQDQLRMEEEFRKKEEIKHKTEIERRMHPRKKDDFDILYDELEVWRLNETEKIKSNKVLTAEQKKEALKQLLDKETELLQTIDRLKINAHKLNKQDKIQQFLKNMSDPKKWLRSDGRYTEVHTPYTTRAKELMDIYNGLRMSNLTLDERLDILLNTKWTVKEFDDEISREIVDLIDREADMLNRGRNEASLEGLRKRLCNLFLRFIENPDFNPEAARYQKIPYELLQKNQTIGKA